MPHDNTVCESLSTLPGDKTIRSSCRLYWHHLEQQSNVGVFKWYQETSELVDFWGMMKQ